MPVPTPGPSGYNTRPLSTDTSYNSHSHSQSLHQPLDQNRISTGDPYDGYDDGLGAIGMAVTSGAGQHERDYTGSTFGHNNTYSPTNGNNPNTNNQIHTPTPQHLITPQNNALLRSPISPSSEVSNMRNNVIGDPGRQGSGRDRYDYDEDEDPEESSGPRPPSYGAVAGFSGDQGGYRNEKSGYQR